MKKIIKAVLIGVMALALTGCARSTDFVKLADKNLQVGMTCEQVNKIMGEPQRIEHDGNYSYHVWYSVTSTIGFTTWMLKNYPLQGLSQSLITAS